MAHYHIYGIDNRGTAEVPFGRVYLTLKAGGDVVGSVGFGAHRDDPDPLAVWESNQAPDAGVDPTLRARVTELLRTTFPLAAQRSPVTP